MGTRTLEKIYSHKYFFSDEVPQKKRSQLFVFLRLRHASSTALPLRLSH